MDNRKIIKQEKVITAGINITNMPIDIIYKIFTYIFNPRDINSTLTSCKFFKSFVTDSHYYKAIRSFTKDYDNLQLLQNEADLKAQLNYLQRFSGAWVDSSNTEEEMKLRITQLYLTFLKCLVQAKSCDLSDNKVDYLTRAIRPTPMEFAGIGGFCIITTVIFSKKPLIKPIIQGSMFTEYNERFNECKEDAGKLSEVFDELQNQIDETIHATQQEPNAQGNTLFLLMRQTHNQLNELVRSRYVNTIRHS